MISRLQTTFLLFALLYGAACLVWWWPQQPLWAVLVALLPLWGLAAVLAVELVLMQRLNRRDAVPLATAAQLLRAWWHEVGAALLIFGWRQPLWWRSPPDWLPAQPTGRRGVVLVHGLMCNRGVWLHWLGHLRAAGHAHVAVNLEPVLGSIDGYAKAIDEAVRRVTEAAGLPPVLVCHSMGGLAARAWLRAYAADARVHRVLTLGTPHAGTWLARFSHTENGRQMRMNSAWLQALKAQEPPSRAKLFVCWYSNCDNIVFPATVAALPGAQHRLVTGVAHVQMVLSPQVVQACLRELEVPVPELPALTR